MSTSSVESLSLTGEDYWGQIVGLTATLPYVHIDMDERSCLEYAPVVPPPENEGRLASRLREVRQQRAGEQTCPGGSYIKLHFQPNASRRDSPLIVYAHDILLKSCAHIRGDDEDAIGDAFLKEAIAFRRFNSGQRFKHIGSVLGPEATSWLKKDGEIQPFGGVVARGLELTSLIRLEHKRTNSNTISTAYKSGTVEELHHAHDVLKSALSALGIAS